MGNPRRAGALGVFVMACLVAAVLVAAGVAPAKLGKKSPAAAAGCELGDKGKIKHVIYVQFDNTHFNRDNPNVPSDLEQMPHLLKFLKDNGTLITNDHTVLISHTGTGILTSLTGVYPDRHGQAVANSYRYYRSDGNTNTGITFGYWTSQVPTAQAFPNPPALSSEDTTYNMLAAPVSGTNPFGVNAPAPWVPYTRAGCDFGAVATANMILENVGIDISAVFGSASPQAAEAATDPAQAQSDYVGFGVHCAQGSSVCSAAKGGRDDLLPNEPSPGYTGYKGLFGARYVNAFLAGVAPTAYPSANVPFNDLDGNPVHDSGGRLGFPGFDGLYASTTLSYIAKMQEKGVPVTFGYISDAHDNHGNSGDIHVAYGPGQQGYVEQLQAYDRAFARFFMRLENDGITKRNTLFVFNVDEGDHFVGSVPTPAGCDGITTRCNYDKIGEVNGNLSTLLSSEQGITTPFSIHSDVAPTIHLRNTASPPQAVSPARTDPTTRAFGRAVADLTAVNPYTGENDILTDGLADSVEMKTLHMVSADPKRTPTLTMFANPDYFFSTSPTTCPSGQNVCIPAQAPPSTQTFAWNHGSIAPEIAQDWIGIVGPGVKHKGIDDKLWTDHTDHRPTMLSILGLEDDYSLDGRTITEILDDGALPKSLEQHRGTLEKLGEVYKQINAPFGQLGQDTLEASTRAIESGSPANDSFYNAVESDIQSLTTDRDALAVQIETALNDAEFNDRAIDEKQAKTWIDQGQALLDRAHDLATAGASRKELKKINHFVVVYEENHSFDNLYGGWEGVNGLSSPDVATHVTQVNQAGNAYSCLKQNDANLQAPSPLTATCTDSTAGTPGGPFVSHFPNTWFTIDDYIKPSDTTCPQNPLLGFASPGGNGWLKGTGAPGGCTRDIVHRFYHEQYQLDGGKQDRYVTGSDAMGLAMGVYDTKALPIYEYLHEKGHPKYAIDDNFFQAAFGGSFLNHQWLIAAASPLDPTGAPGGANESRHPVLDNNGMPSNEPLYTSTITPPIPPDRELTATCAQVATLPPPINTRACGNYGVNTMQPVFYPSGTFGALLPAQTAPTIGDELTRKGVDWAWYAGGWANANGDTASPYYTNGKDGPSATPTGCSDPYVDPNSRAGVPAAHWPRCPSNLFQYHHQPFNYFAAFSTATAAGLANRAAHLRDEQEFLSLANSSDHDCNLKPVSFVKPFGTENEHPGYASEPSGSDHLVSLLKSIEDSKCAKDTMVIVTYDEFGGEWDHVPPPGQGNDNGPHDVWGPGTRVPALVIAPHLKGDFVVDSAEHDTTSILTTIEHRYGLDPLGSRDAKVNDLSTVFGAKKQ
jgi:acid phosphatase